MELKIKEMRKARKMTQQQLADAIGASKRQIGAWERGENELPMDYAVSIADLFDCTVDDVAGRVVYAVVSLDDQSKKQSNEADELLDLYRSMTDEGRYQLMVYARGLAATHPKNNLGEVS